MPSASPATGASTPRFQCRLRLDVLLKSPAVSSSVSADRRGVSGSVRRQTRDELRRRTRQAGRTLELTEDVEEDVEQLAKALEHGALARRAQGRARERDALAHRREREAVERVPPEVEERLGRYAGLGEEREEGWRRGEDDARERRRVLRQGRADLGVDGALEQALDEAYARASRGRGDGSALRTSTWGARQGEMGGAPVEMAAVAHVSNGTTWMCSEMLVRRSMMTLGCDVASTSPRTWQIGLA